MFRISKFFKLYYLTILSGFLIGTSFIPFPPWAILFCYVPLSVFLCKPDLNWKQIFFGAWISQFILSLIGFYWICFVSHEFGFLPWPVAILILLLFASFVHLYIPCAALLAFLLKKKLKLRPLIFIFAFLILVGLGEIYWPSLFPWNLAYTLLWIKMPVIQLADIFGIQGLSILAYLFNGALVWAAFQKDRLYQAGIVFLVILVVIGMSFWGQMKQKQWQKTDSVLKVLAVQANIGNMEKYQAERGVGGPQQRIVNEYFALTREALAKYSEADIVLWPESAYPDYLDEDIAFTRRFTPQFINFVKSIHKPIISGAFAKQKIPKGLSRDYNGLFLYNGDGKMAEVPYHKTQLLAYGEYTPLVEQFHFLAEVSPAGTGFSFGTGPQVFDFQNFEQKVKLGLQICYESLDPLFSAKLVQKGAQIILNVTNDSWFGPTAENYQHLYMTLGRAIEVRRPLVRGTNTGITAAILADGTLLEQSPRFETWFGLYEVKYLAQPEVTFYSHYGFLLGPVVILLLLVLLILGRQKSARHPSSP